MPGNEAQSVADKGFRRWAESAGMPLLVFVLGLMTGFPIAIFGFDFLMMHAASAFAVLFGLLFVIVVACVVIVAMRERIWARIFKQGDVELHQLSDPLQDVVRLTSERRVAEASIAASGLARVILARYAWIVTRRWIIGAVTGFVAVIAALAGSALLFQQNQLLRTQGELMREQTDRLLEQNRFIAFQIELGEAQRSTSIVPEILQIGALVGEEVHELSLAGNSRPSINDLSAPLRARLVAASNASRPYRYLRTPLADLDDALIMRSGLLRRTDLPAAELARDDIAELTGATPVFDGEQGGAMSDRPVSPERGQLLAMLATVGITDIGALLFADFSFAELRTAALSGVQLQSTMLRFADFDRQTLIACSFDGAAMEHARLRNARISHGSFTAAQHPLLEILRPTELAGADFSGAIIAESNFSGSRGLGLNFDGAVLHNVRFSGTDLSGATFRNTIFGTVDFTGAALRSVDFDGAIVFAADFLDQLAGQVEPETFVAERFELTAIDADTFAEHARWADAWLDGLEEGQAYRVDRVAEFE